jgi:hypothetical protein
MKPPEFSHLPGSDEIPADAANSGSGLTDAFATAVENDTPILTAVSPMFAFERRAFSSPLVDFAPPSAPALDGW